MALGRWICEMKPGNSGEQRLLPAGTQLPTILESLLRLDILQSART